MNKKKICCYCEIWKSGGIESFLNNLLHNIDLESVDVHIVSACQGSSIFTMQLQRIGIHFFQLSGNVHYLLKNYWKFYRLLKQEHYDVVHLNVYHGLSLLYAYLAKRVGVPVRIVHAHNTALQKSPGRWLKLALHNTVKLLLTNAATDLWACSSDAAYFLFSKRALKKKGYSFIPNGVELSRFRFDPYKREADKKQLNLEGNLVIGNVGRLSYQKNQTFLIDVFSEVLHRRPKSKLLLVGEGEDLVLLKKKAERLHLEEQIIFYGSSHNVERLLWAMDIFVFPSRFEGLPITLVEAQAAGLPVLCSDNITQQAIITPLVKTLSLASGAKCWADTLLEWNPPMSRCQGAFAVRKAGFDVGDVSRRIGESYKK